MARGDKQVAAPEQFLNGSTEGVEAIVLRIGGGDAKLVLVDGDGRWDHWVYHTVDECRAKAEALGIGDIHVGEYPEKTRVRMNAYRRPPSSYEAGAYPEIGGVGPLRPYRENRPRPPKLLPEEEAE